MLVRKSIGIFLVVFSASCGVDERANPAFRLASSAGGLSFTQWGGDPSHSGRVNVSAQRPRRVITSVVFDPFVRSERLDGHGDVDVHYQAPLVDGDDLFMEFKSGTYVACVDSGSPPGCGAAGWDGETWSERRYAWEGQSLVEKWSFESDWKPEPNAGTELAGLAGWEPVFHAALAGDYVVVPGAGGTVFVIRRSDGSLVARVNPFDSIEPSTFVAGPLTVAPDGSVYYNAIALDSPLPWFQDVAGAWLVRIAPDGTPSKVRFTDLIPDAPNPNDACLGSFDENVDHPPWPPAPDATPPTVACGGQRPPLNIAVAVAPDGTVYTASRAHFANRYAYLVAAQPDLTPKWAASLRDRLDDGCGAAALPPNGKPGGCRAGAHDGVDPETNERPAGAITDLSTASPVVAPDGSILFAAFTRHNFSRGHLFKMSAGGSFLSAYDFGWDVTPAIFTHDGGYSVIIKDNHYDVGSYCSDAAACPPAPEGPYQITQLDSTLRPEWSYTNENHSSCTRADDGQVTCTADHPSGFEWCVNAAAIDADGTVFANGEDGVLYAIHQGAADVESLLLGEAGGAAYTPLSIDSKGRVYAESSGELFVVGE